MKVGTVFIIVSFLLALIASIAGTSYFYSKSVETMEEQVYNHLKTTVQSRAHHVETWLDEKKILAENLALIGKVERLLLADKTDSDYNDKVEAVNERLKKTVDLVDSILSMGLLDKNGILIASTTLELIGTDYSNIDYFQKTKKEISFEVIESPGKAPFFGVGAPVNDLKTGEFLGMIGININLEDLNKITTDRTGLGETGEVYLINKEGYMMTPSRFLPEEETFLKRKVDSINSRECLEDLGKYGAEAAEKDILEKEDIKIFSDYRGVKVLGTDIPIPELEWCLLAEIDEAEILGKQREIFQKVALILIVAIVIIMVLAGFFVGRFIDKVIVLKKWKKKSI